MDNQMQLRTFSWNKELETGIEIVDSQHKDFIKNANKFIIKVRFNKANEGMAEEFEFLKDYLLYHFQTEETFLFDSGYPDFTSHQAEHLQIKFETKRIGTIMAFEEDKKKVLDEFTAFINSWIISHIMGSDLKFANYYKNSDNHIK